MRFLFVCCAALGVSCGALGPPHGSDDGGASSTGGGAASGGGGGVVQGGGAGGGSAQGGGGGTASTLGDLSWGVVGITGSDTLVGFSGEADDLWAIEDFNGSVHHSTGGGFQKLFAFPGGAKGLYAAGGTVVLMLTRELQTCVSGCDTANNYDEFSFLGGGLNYFSAALCGESKDHIVAVVTDTDDNAILYEWHGTQWEKTNSNLGLVEPQACWFDSGNLYITGRDGVAVVDTSGVSSFITLSSGFTAYYGGATVGGTNWVVGASSFVASGTGFSLTPVTPPQAMTFLRAAGGLRGDQVLLLGYYNETLGPGLVWNGSTLKKIGAGVIPGFVSGTTVRVFHQTSDSEFFLAGGDIDTPIVVRGRR